MKRKVIGVMLALVLSFPLVAAPLKADANVEQRAQKPCYGKNAIKLYSEMRRLWKDHVYWTRSFVISDTLNLPDKDATLKRLLQNQVDIGNAFKEYYGPKAGDQTAKLLTEHIVIAGQVVDAAKKGDQNAFKKANAAWYKNADDIAKYWSKLNPNWKEKELKDLLYMHLKLLTDDVVARLKKDYPADVRAFDAGENHIIVLADELTNGIMKQFPKKFKN